jgi:putative ABC transport system permease protein
MRIKAELLLEYFRLVLSSLRRRLLRTFLTMIGIFIGIAAVVSLVSIGQGLQHAIDDQFQKLGSDKLMISYKGAVGPGISISTESLTKDDYRFLKQIKELDDVIYMNFGSGEIEYKNQKVFQIVIGYPTDERQKLYDEFLYPSILEGRKIRRGDKYKVVTGINYFKDNVFKTNLRLNEKLKIQGKDFEVIGYYDRIGNPQDDRQIYMEDKMFEELFNRGDKVDFIVAQVAPGNDISYVADKVERQLADYRGLKEGNEDFTVLSFQDMMASYLVILDVIQIVLIGIAGISLFVGGIGIMNTMYTAVTERTSEIGIMKAIGARNEDILALFLIESGFLGLVGGAVGIGTGWLLAKGVEYIATKYLLTTMLTAYFPWYLMVGSLLFSFVTGALAGTLPAISASKLQPVQALRYE